MSNEQDDGPLGGVKVKIKDGTGKYVTSSLGLGTHAQAHKFWRTLNSSNGRVRLAKSKSSSEYLASEGRNANATWSSHRDTPEWTAVASNGKNRFYIHDNTYEHLAVEDDVLVIRQTGTDFELVEDLP